MTVCSHWSLFSVQPWHPLVPLEYRQQALKVWMFRWILNTQDKTAHKIRERNCRTGESMQCETCVLLGWLQWTEGGIRVWNVMSGDTRWQCLLIATWCALPLDYNGWKAKKCVCVCVFACVFRVREQKNMNVSLSLHPSRLSATRTTWHLPMQWGIWYLSAHKCSARYACVCVCVAEHYHPKSVFCWGMWCVCICVWE